jgi:hypothetical protein
MSATDYSHLLDTAIHLALYRTLERVSALAVAAVLIVCGTLLFRWGVGGKASLKVNNGKLSLQMLNAAPGLLFALLGTIVLFFSVVSPLTFDSTMEDGSKLNLNYSRADTLPAWTFVESVAATQIPTDPALATQQLKGLKDRASTLQSRFRSVSSQRPPN